MERFRYDFFVSYAHADLERVRRLDRALRELLRRPLRRAGFQVFRDERRLGAGTDLTERLRSAMRESKTLLVVLSPAATRSPWVDREVAYWCEELGRADQMIIVRADPAIDLGWDDTAHAFVRPERLTPALVRATKAVPFYAELGTSAAAEHDAAVRIAASVLGRAPEEIAGEDHRMQRRRRRLAISAVSGLAVLTIVSVAASVLAVRSSETAKRNERRAVADSLANRAIVEEDDRPDKALALALAARRLDRDSSGTTVLLRLLLGYDGRDRFLRGPAGMGAVAVSARGDRLAIGDDDGGVRLLALPARAIPSRPAVELGSRVNALAFADDGHLVAALGDNRVVELAIRSPGELEKSAELRVRRADSWAFDRRTGLIAVGGYDPSVGELGKAYLSLIRRRAGSLIHVSDAHTSRTRDLATFAALAFNADATRLLAAHYRQAEVFSVPSLTPAPGSDGLVNASFIEGESAAFRADGAVAIGGNPSISADRTGIVEVHAADGSRHFGDASFELSVNELERCDRAVYFGTRAGEYGRLQDPKTTYQRVAQTQPLANVAGEVRDIACGDKGPVAVTATGGFLHVRQTREDPYGFVGTQPALTLRAHDDEEGVLKNAQVVGMALERGGGALVTRRRRRVPFMGDDAAKAPAVLRGAPGGAYNCISAGEETLVGIDEPTTPVKVGRCGDLELQVSGEFAATLSIRREGRTIATIPAGERVGNYAIAMSKDARRLFVGGYVNGVLYDLTTPSAPRAIVTIPGDEVFTAASFAAGGDVLITSETTPHGTFEHVRVQVLDGAPLERLACVAGAGSLAGTNAMELLSSDERAELTRSGGAMCAVTPQGPRREQT